MFNRRGISRAVVLLAIIAIALIIAIAVPVVQSKKESMARSLDDLYVNSAEDEAYLRWVQENSSFSAIYDSENKTFIETGATMRTVTPYGEAKEHEGMVLFVKVSDNGSISTKWVYQENDASLK